MDFQSSLTETNFVFNKPIFLDQQRASSIRTFGAFPFIVMYNLALSHHLRAAQNRMIAEESKKALTLYELAYASLMAESRSLPLMHGIAIVNNMGQIHSSLKNEERAQLCFQDVLSSILYLREYGEEESIDELDGFMGNLMPILLKQTPSVLSAQPAPAA